MRARARNFSYKESDIGNAAMDAAKEEAYGELPSGRDGREEPKATEREEAAAALDKKGKEAKEAEVAKAFIEARKEAAAAKAAAKEAAAAAQLAAEAAKAESEARRSIELQMAEAAATTTSTSETDMKAAAEVATATAVAAALHDVMRYCMNHACLKFAMYGSRLGPVRWF